MVGHSAALRPVASSAVCPCSLLCMGDIAHAALPLPRSRDVERRTTPRSWELERESTRSLELDRERVGRSLELEREMMERRSLELERERMGLPTSLKALVCAITSTPSIPSSPSVAECISAASLGLERESTRSLELQRKRVRRTLGFDASTLLGVRARKDVASR